MLLLSLYLSRTILIRLVATAGGLIILVLIPEIASQSSKLFLSPGIPARLAGYLVVTTPLIFLDIFLLAIYLAILLALSDFKYHNELAALLSVGISPWQLVRAMTPFLLLLGFGHFLAQDLVAGQLLQLGRHWNLPDYRVSAYSAPRNNAIWFKSGNDIIRGEKFNVATDPESRGTVTSWYNITIFRRNKGDLIEQIAATSAHRQNDIWYLEDARVYRQRQPNPTYFARLVYDGSLDYPADLHNNRLPEAMSSHELIRYIRLEDPHFSPAYYHRAVFATRLSSLIAPLFVGMFIVALAGRATRAAARSRIDVVYIWSGLLGFVFFIIAGVFRNLAETGLISATLGAALPLFLIATSALWFGLERHRGAQRRWINHMLAWRPRAQP